MKPVKKVGKLQPVFVQDLLVARLDDSKAGAGQDARQWPAQNFVDCSNLSKVSDLGRAGDVSRGWQQIILHDGAKRNARTETRRLLLDQPDDLIAAVRA